ncbi:hypothetical protein BDC45DRAFT_538406 [Circinella umbellata]|nr:hypothetical protein BDC45DRAFT_538406 [Circinella umbellata]
MPYLIFHIIHQNQAIEPLLANNLCIFCSAILSIIIIHTCNCLAKKKSKTGCFNESPDAMLAMIINTVIRPPYRYQEIIQFACATTMNTKISTYKTNNDAHALWYLNASSEFQDY